MGKFSSLKDISIKYRKRGFSYGFISEKTGASKSTLSDWLQKIPYTPNKEMIKRIGMARMKSGVYKHNQMIVSTKRIKIAAKKELGKLNRRDLWLLGIGLYLGEGSKTHNNVRIINSDAGIVKLSVLWFKRICGLKTENFSPVVHIYPNNNLKKTIKYWSKITSIPKDQFQKTQIDIRTNKSTKKRNMLPYGTINLQIRSRGKKKFGRFLHRKIMGWIESATKQITRV
ncbi:MAG: hypothetical protein UT22_C0046G0004 [Parcubacteria group bacterium GW2011_GWC2_39_11]|nr:MAG: hypothetical protein UT22_C0046G0004 [Parcubacteria group bacterium GW2011_GWC2_39_11]